MCILKVNKEDKDMNDKHYASFLEQRLIDKLCSLGFQREAFDAERHFLKDEPFELGPYSGRVDRSVRQMIRQTNLAIGRYNHAHF